LARQSVGDDGAVDTGSRDMTADPVDNQKRKREKYPFAQFFDFEDRAKSL
jgi:hypothetical protein